MIIACNCVEKRHEQRIFWRESQEMWKTLSEIWFESFKTSLIAAL